MPPLLQVPRVQALPPIIEPGALWHIATIMGRTIVDLPNGGQEEVDAVIVADEPMSIEPLTVAERSQPGTILAEATHRIRLYFVPGVRNEHRVDFIDPYDARPRTFEIIGVINPGERSLMLELLTVEKV